jgi:drug/metabolite transporter (DMT)-like permease
VTSGLGYILWYAALKQLTVTRAATVQLSVPVLAALGGTVFLDEPMTALLIGASALVLTGVSLVIFNKRAA